MENKKSNRGCKPKDPDKLLKEAIEIANIKKNNCMFNEDVYSRMAICEQTYFKYKLNKNTELQKLLKQRRVETKLKLKAKWLDSDNPTLQIALFKLIANKEEKDSLANTSHLKVDQNEITRNFEKLADIMDEVHKTSGNRSDNTDSE